MAKKPHILKNVVFQRRPDPDLGNMTDWSARQYVFIDGLTGNSVEQARQAAMAADSEADADNPSLGNLTVTGATANLLAHGKAMVRTDWGQPNFSLPSAPRPTVQEWSSPFVHRVRIYLKKSGASFDFADNGEQVAMGPSGPLYVDIEAPAAYLYRRTITSTKPTDLTDGVGDFQNVSEVNDLCYQHFPDVKRYDNGNGTSSYHIVRVYEWRKVRMSVTAPGTTTERFYATWVKQMVDPEGIVRTTAHHGAPVA